MTITKDDATNAAVGLLFFVVFSLPVSMLIDMLWTREHLMEGTVVNKCCQINPEAKNNCLLVDIEGRPVSVWCHSIRWKASKVGDRVTVVRKIGRIWSGEQSPEVKED